LSRSATALAPLPLSSLHPSAPPPDLHSFPTRRSSDLAPASRTASSPTPQPARTPSSCAPMPCSPTAICACSKPTRGGCTSVPVSDRKSTRLNSSHVKISYAVFCLKKKNKKKETSEQRQ